AGPCRASATTRRCASAGSACSRSRSRTSCSPAFSSCSGTLDDTEPARIMTLDLRRFYLLEVFSGLALTAAHFFRNMGRHVAFAVGASRTGGAVTIQYPEERRPY